jgi:phage head maturation protease
MAQTVQSLAFQKDNSPGDVNGGDGWTVSAATSWADDHDFRSDKVDEGDTQIRLRQINPDSCDDDSFQTLTENFPVGVSAVTCDAPDDARTVPTGMERRVIHTSLAIEYRDAEAGEGPMITGHAAVVNKWSEDLGGFREKISRGAFGDRLGDDVRALFNHDENIVLGRTDVDGASFGFIVAEDEWRERKDGMVERTITKFERLFDISPVTFPAYPDTAVATRSLQTFVAALKDETDKDVAAELDRFDRATTLHEMRVRQPRA